MLNDFCHALAYVNILYQCLSSYLYYDNIILDAIMLKIMPACIINLRTHWIIYYVHIDSYICLFTCFVVMITMCYVFPLNKPN